MSERATAVVLFGGIAAIGLAVGLLALPDNGGATLATIFACAVGAYLFLRRT